MTLPEILDNEALRQHEFPVCGEKVFLAHAADCPLPRRVAEAIANYVRQASADDQETMVLPALLTRGRQLGAQLLECHPEEIAFVGPTSLALSCFAAGLRLRKGDNVLIYFDDYPSNVYPWMSLGARNIEVRMLNVRRPGVIRAIDVMGQVDEDTKLVALASCHFVSGWRLDHEAIGKYLHERGILFCLDGIQTLGAFPTTVDHVDLLAADAHKWLLGPCAAGLMFARNSVANHMNPPILGWHNVRCPNYVTQEQITFRAGASRFEAGSHNLLGLVGLVAALELLLEIGVETIAAELLRKRAWLVPALQAKGFHVLAADAPPGNASAIITFSKPGLDMAALHQKLADAKIVTSLRTDRVGQHYIRLSPHFYNTDNELQRLVEAL
jgi:selenocysteine lyase/cysteine desulfurase